MSQSLFQLPDELILTPVLHSFPCREQQIRSLATLLYPSAAPCRTLTIHGVEATGKTAITTSLLRNISLHTPHLRHALIPAAQCITARHLFERILASIADALDGHNANGHTNGGGTRWQGSRRCETLAQLDVELCKMLKYEDRGEGFRFVLVLDGLDKARDAPPTLVPALARLSEIIPSLTTVFILTSPPAHTLRTPSSPTLHFPPYDKPSFLQILALPATSPQTALRNASLPETQALWLKFCAAVHDALVRSAARSLPAFRAACEALWPRFVAPVERGSFEVKDFSKLLVAARAHFQDESVLNPSIVSVRPITAASTAATPSTVVKKDPSDLSALLPKTARILLMCAYLASHNAPRHDLTLFSTHHASRRRRRAPNHHGAVKRAGPGGGGSHRKIARKLLGAQAFVLERMLAIFAAVRGEWTDDMQIGRAGVDGDVGVSLATLVSLRLLNRVGTGGDVMDRGGKWRINVGWEVIRGIGRTMGVEVEEWLIE